MELSKTNSHSVISIHEISMVNTVVIEKLIGVGSLYCSDLVLSSQLYEYSVADCLMSTFLFDDTGTVCVWGMGYVLVLAVGIKLVWSSRINAHERGASLLWIFKRNSTNQKWDAVDNTYLFTGT